jgi:excisionase family DNA binding protein
MPPKKPSDELCSIPKPAPDVLEASDESARRSTATAPSMDLSGDRERIAYKVSQAARAIGFSRYVLYDAIREGHLRAYQPMPGGDLVIVAEDLRAWIMRRPAPSQPDSPVQDADPDPPRTG